MDHLDHVSETEQQILDMRLKAVTQHSTRPSARFCAECDNEIPETPQCAARCTALRRLQRSAGN